MNHKLILSLVEGGRGLEARNIRAMPKLCLCIAPNDIDVLNERHPVCALFGIGKVLKRRAEHGCMEGQGQGALKVSEHVDVRWLQHIILEELAPMLLDENFHSAPQILVTLLGSHIVELEGIFELRVLSQQVHGTLPDSQFFRAAMHESSHLCLIKGTLLAL